MTAAKGIFTRALAALSLLAMAMAVSGCTEVLETRPFQPGVEAAGETCTTPFGVYYLPKALLQIYFNPPETLVVTPKFVADDSQRACLDYLASATSDDVIKVTRTADGLLEAVSSKVTDRTPDIALKLLNVAESAAIAGGRAQTGIAAEPINLTFDPFDARQARTAKEALRRLGLCLFVEGYSFDPEKTTPQEWCAQTNPKPYRAPVAALAYLPAEEIAHAAGLLYRPNIAHKIVMMRKSDPGGRGGWILTNTWRIEMPNVSPIFSLNIGRTVFATNRTEVTFRQGVLADIRIEKGSELWGIATIPVALAKTIAEIPAQILQFQLADTQAEAKLLDAQATLLAATIAYSQKAAAAGRSDGRSGNFVDNCINAQGPPDECQRLATGVAQ
jgi:hypothetical protein